MQTKSDALGLGLILEYKVYLILLQHQRETKQNKKRLR